MKNLVPENTLSEIRLKVDIVELISETVPLKGAGRSYKALCPFHSEKTPSFMVNPEKQIFHCFGCGAGGDIFSFVMRTENISFPEAIEMLAAKAGIAISKEHSFPEESQKKMLFEATEKVASYFEKVFLNDIEAREARDYLRARGLKRNAVDTFRIGYCPFEEKRVLDALNQLKVSDEILEKIGVLTDRRDGRHVRFKDRIIFPIQDAQGRIVGFGGRALGDRLPKYLNSPETPLFSKSHILYGLNHAKRAILQSTQVILVEGYLDVISVYCAGVQNVVASLGTAFNPSHVHLLKRYAQEVMVAYDGDEAGIEASMRALEVFLDQDIIVKIARIPLGDDPDSWIRKNGKASFEEIVRNAPSMMDFKLEILMGQFRGRDEKGKLVISREMLRLIQQLRNPILQDHYLKLLSEKVGVRELALREELGNTKRPKKEFEKVSKSKPPTHSQLEEDILRILLLDNSLIPYAAGKIQPDTFEGEVCNLLYKNLLGNKNASDSHEYSEIQQLRAKLLANTTLFKEPKTELDKFVTHLTLKSYEKKWEILSQRLREYEATGKDMEKVVATLSEIQNLQKEIAFLKKA